MHRCRCSSDSQADPRSPAALLDREIDMLETPDWSPTLEHVKHVVSSYKGDIGHVLCYMILQYYKRAKNLREGFKRKHRLDAVWGKARQKWHDPGPGLWNTLQDE